MSEQEAFSHQIEQMSPKRGDLLVISVPFPVKAEVRKNLEETLRGKAERLSCELLVLEAGVTAQLQPGLHGLLEEQKKQTAILERMEKQQGLLIQALAEDQGAQDLDAQPLTYMDGTPCR